MSSASASTSTMSSASASAPAIVDGLDSTEEDTTEITLIAPGGLRLTITKEMFKYSEALGLLQMYGDDDAVVFDLKEKLNIHGGNPNADLVDGKLPHVLYGVDDKYYKLVVDFLHQYHTDKGVMPTIPDRCTMFKPEVVAPMAYWPLVKDLSLQDVHVMDKVSIFFGIDDLRLLNELAMAFWIKHNPEKIEEFKHLLKDVIDRDVVIYERQKRLKAEAEALATKEKDESSSSA